MGAFVVVEFRAVVAEVVGALLEVVEVVEEVAAEAQGGVLREVQTSSSSPTDTRVSLSQVLGGRAGSWRRILSFCFRRLLSLERVQRRHIRYRVLI